MSIIQIKGELFVLCRKRNLVVDARPYNLHGCIFTLKRASVDRKKTNNSNKPSPPTAYFIDKCHRVSNKRS